MKDIQAPLTYSPHKLLDHVTLSIGLTIKIGVNNCDDVAEIENFKAIMLERLKTTGAEVIIKRSNPIELDPYTGSKREKLYTDMMNEEKPNKDSENAH